MLSRMIRFAAPLFALALAAPAALAQSTSAPKEGKGSDYVEATGFKGKVIELRNREPNDIWQTIQPLGSGFKGAIITPNNQLKTITVRDFPENIAAIEEAIKRLDTPAVRPSAPDVELHLHVLLASNGEPGSAAYPDELKDVLKQLQATVNYKNYHLLTTVVQHARSTSRIEGQGNLEIPPQVYGKPADVFYGYQVGRVNAQFGTPERPALLLEGFEFSLNGIPGGAPRLRNDLTIRDGEKVVVGTAGLKSSALVLVLSVKVIK